MRILGRAVVVIGFVSLASAGCEGPHSGSPDGGGGQVSDCGGFLTQEETWWDTALDYCAAERLHWKFEEAAGRLRLANTRVSLNCCGEREVTAVPEGGTWVVTETDEPGDGRCRCMCLYDMTIDIEGVVSGQQPIRLVRDVTDSGGGPETVLSGSLDLSRGSGVIPIDETPTEWCQ